MFKRKPLHRLVEEADGGAHGLRRALGAMNLVSLGVGVIVGAGIFVVTGTAAAQYAGPGIVLSFLPSAVACAFAGLCYAEFASMILIAVAVNAAGPALYWLRQLINIGAIAGQTSVILVLLLWPPRISFSMSHDGLLPPVFSNEVDVVAVVRQGRPVRNAVIEAERGAPGAHERLHLVLQPARRLG
jgi:amino acid transporter